MNSCRITGSLARTSGEISISLSSGTSRQPSTTCPFARTVALEFLLARPPRCVFLGQEHHADAVLARRRQLDAPRRHLVAKQLVRDLQQYPGAVAEQLVRPVAPRWLRFNRMRRPFWTMSWLLTPLIWATNPTPQESRSWLGS